MATIFTNSVCHINLGAIARNFRKLGSAEKLLPVIKSDAYGHGLLEVAKALALSGARRFAVGTLSEGLALRNAGFDQDILLLLGCCAPEEFQQAYAANMLPLAGSFEDLAIISSLRHTGPLPLALKFDTGMSRLGFTAGQLPVLLDHLATQPQLAPLLAVSHLATADMPEKETDTLAQIRQFSEITTALQSRYPALLPSLGNSAALRLDLPGLLRPGIALYGANPLEGTNIQYDYPELEWGMSLEAPVMQVRELSAGTHVSYGQIFTAAQPMRVAVIGAGYANGITRNLSNRFDVLINGRRCPQVGRICMGMFMADVTHLDKITAGDAAWIMGGETAEGEKAVTPLELAERQGTIPYEILCLIGSLNPRRYHH